MHTQVELYSCMLSDLENLGKGGNPAAASDILRILSPCFRLGNYTDFDVDLNFEELPITDIVVKTPIILPIKSHNYCNDVIIIDPHATEEELAFITELQANIVKAYQGAEPVLAKILNQVTLGTDEQKEQLEILVEASKKEQYPLISLRSDLQQKINQSATDEEAFNFWRQAYMQTVMQSTGPGGYQQLLERREGYEAPPSFQVSSFITSSFASVVQSQVQTKRNDASWVPTKMTANHQEKFRQIKEAFQTDKEQYQELKKIAADESVEQDSIQLRG